MQAFTAGERSSFDELVTRHVDLVYASARRQVKDPHLADDITQAVFLVLFQRAKSLKPGTVLSAWLHRTTQYCAANAQRMDSNRRRHEQKAVAMNVQYTTDPGDVLDRAELMSRLDELVNKLPDMERKVLIMRYFQGRENAEVALVLGVSVAAAAKKVQRAVERLRRMLERNGQPTAAAALRVGLAGIQRFSASADLVRSIGSTGTSSLPSQVHTIASGAMRDAARRQYKNIAAVGALAMVLVAVIGLAIRWVPAEFANPVAAAQATTQPAATRPTQPPAWRAKFDEVYHLDPGEAVRRVRPPYIPERNGFVEDIFKPTFDPHGAQNAAVDKLDTAAEMPVAMYLEFNSGTNRVERWTRSSSDHAWAMDSLMVNLVGIEPANLELAGPLAGIPLPGDWVIRRGATQQQRLDAMQRITAETPAAFSAEKERLKRNVVVAHGHYSKDDFIDGIVRLSVYEDLNRTRESGEPGWFFRELGHMLNCPIVNEWDGSQGVHIEFNYFKIHTAGMNGDDDKNKRAEILKQLSEQMHIQLTEEIRDVDVWVITPVNHQVP